MEGRSPRTGSRGAHVGRAPRGSWRDGEPHRLEPTDTIENPALADVSRPFRGLYEALERRGGARWVTAIQCCAAGVLTLALPYATRDPMHRVDPTSPGLGWMRYGIVGLLVLVGLWCASMPYRGTTTARVLKGCGVAAAVLPILARLAGWI